MNPEQKKLLGKKYAHLNDNHADGSSANFTSSIAQIPTLNKMESNDPNENKQLMRPESTEFISSSTLVKTAIRSISEYFPITKSMYQHSVIPLSVMVQPFAPLFSYEEFPISNFGPTNPVIRCDECRAYINPYSKFEADGNIFICNFCDSKNTIPAFYHAPIDKRGIRVDRDKRPELHSAVYDIKASMDYLAGPPAPPTYFFLIDVSEKSIQNGSLDLFCGTLTELIQGDMLWGDTRTQIGFIAFDSNVHIFDLNPELKHPRVITLADSDSEHLPTTSEMLMNLSESKQLILNLLQILPKLFEKSKQNGSCLVDALTVANQACKNFGGRLVILQSNPNIIAEKGLSISIVPNSIDPKLLQIPSSNVLFEVASRLNNHFISCDIFIFSSLYRNAITIGELARHLNGDIHYYVETRDNLQRFYYEFKSSMLREYTWESVFRMRISKGWKVTNIFGNCILKTLPDLLSFQNADESTGLLYELQFEEEKISNGYLYLQTALLYTNSYGERRIRVMNHAIACNPFLGEFYQNLDPQVVACTLVKQALQKYYTNSVSEINQFLISKTKLIFNEIIPNKKGQIPQNLITFVLNMLGITKHRLFRDIKSVYGPATDQKNVLRLRLTSMYIDETLIHFVPYLFDVLSMNDGNYGSYEESGQFIFPPLLSLSANSMTQAGIYLLDDGYSLYLYVGSQVEPPILKTIFGAKSIEEIQNLDEDLLVRDEKIPLVVRLHNLIAELRGRKKLRYEYLHIIREGERSQLEVDFFEKLIEDKSDKPASFSFQEFINQMSYPVLQKL